MKLEKEFKANEVLHAAEMNEIVEAINMNSNPDVLGAEVYNDYAGDNIASGEYSSAHNFLTHANGDYSFAAGLSTSAIGFASNAFGKATVSNNKYESSFGSYNVSHAPTPEEGDMPDKSTIFTVGIGNGERPENAIEVMASGDIYIKDVGNYDGINYAGAQTLLTMIHNAASYYHVGGTADRTNLSDTGGVMPGACFYDTDIKKPCWWDGTKWTLADGADPK